MTQVTLNNGSVDSAGALALKTNGTTTAVTIDTSQNVGIGTSTIISKLTVAGGVSLSGGAGTGNAFYPYYNSATSYNAIGSDSNGGMTFITGISSPGIRATIDSSGNLLVGTTTAIEKLTVAGSVAATGYVYPNTDNTYSTGLSGKRWSVVYAATGTINTSDAREKTAVASLTQSEINAAKQLAAEVGSYKWLAAIEEKGDAARQHIGMTVQRAIEIMESNGLTPFNYGFICYDEWEDKFVKDEDGNDVLNMAAGNRFSFRMDELSLFISRGQQAAIQEQQALITTLTERITALEAK